MDIKAGIPPSINRQYFIAQFLSLYNVGILGVLNYQRVGLENAIGVYGQGG